MDIDYTAECITEDFHPQDGVSSTLSGETLKAMGFVTIDKAWKINGLSAEQRGNEIILAVLCSGNSISNEPVQHKISAKIKPVHKDWQGDVRLIVKSPTIH